MLFEGEGRGSFQSQGIQDRGDHAIHVCQNVVVPESEDVELGASVTMPNHLHGILILHDRAATSSPPVGATHWVAPTHARGLCRGSIGAIIGAYKMAVTRHLAHGSGGTTQIWQRNYYERIIRNEVDWNRFHLYIESNASNWAMDEENPEFAGS